MTSEIEIQANYLAQQWYNLPIGERPEVHDLLPKYLHLFPAKEEQETFLKETLRIAKELLASPRDQAEKTESFELFKNMIAEHLEIRQ